MAARTKKVKEREDLVRDLHSKAIINVDKTSYKTYKSRKAALKQRERRIENLENEVAILKEMVANLIKTR